MVKGIKTDAKTLRHNEHVSRPKTNKKRKENKRASFHQKTTQISKPFSRQAQKSKKNNNKKNVNNMTN